MIAMDRVAANEEWRFIKTPDVDEHKLCAQIATLLRLAPSALGQHAAAIGLCRSGQRPFP